jgi:hypothetical protein
MGSFLVDGDVHFAEAQFGNDLQGAFQRIFSETEC